MAYQQEILPDLRQASQGCGTKTGHEMSSKYWSNFGPRRGTEKWNIACHISKQRMSQSSVIAATANSSELMSPDVKTQDTGPR